MSDWTGTGAPLIAAPSALHRFEQDKWTTERFVEVGGVVGTRLTHIYTALWDATLASLDLEEGDDMPDRPLAGVGSTATVDQALWGEKAGTSRRRVVVVGFEAKGW